jgi:hypothetical protein
MSKSTLQPETIRKLCAAPFPALAMIAGMQLELFTPLAARPMTARELADALGVGVTRLEPLLYALSAANLLTVKDGQFANSPEADHFLVRGKPAYLGDLHSNYMARYHEVMQTATTIRTGIPQARRDYTTMSTAEFEGFLMGLHPNACAAGSELLARFDFSACRNLVDVGGGSGGVALTLAAACPDLRVTVVELAQVTPITNRIIAQEGLTERVVTQDCDVVGQQMAGTYDGAVLRSLIQVLSRGDARRVLHNVSKVLQPGSPIFVLGQVIDDSRVTPSNTAAYNLVFINQHDGQAYTESEYRSWMTEAGFMAIERSALAGASLFFARKSM